MLDNFVYGDGIGVGIWVVFCLESTKLGHKIFYSATKTEALRKAIELATLDVGSRYMIAEVQDSVYYYSKDDPNIIIDRG